MWDRRKCEGARDNGKEAQVMNKRLQRQRQKRRELKADERLMLHGDPTFAGVSKKIKEMKRIENQVCRPTL